MQTAFEKWFRKEVGAGSLSYHDGRYSNQKIDLMWKGWKAAKTHT